MDNNSEWETVHTQYYRNDDAPIAPITIYPSLNRHVVEVQVLADSIPKTWTSAGRLYCFLQDPNTYIYPRATLIENVPVNVSKVYKLPDDTEYYWLQYQPHRWYKWQALTVKAWIYG
ncbi:MAG: hypothetical protein WBA13_21135 [Microcoleaceae cyanobacterium]